MENLQKVANKKLQGFSNSLTNLLKLKDKAAILKLEHKDIPERLTKDITITKFELICSLLEELELRISSKDFDLLPPNAKITLKSRLPSELFNSHIDWNPANVEPPKDKDSLHTDDESKSILVLNENGIKVFYDYDEKKWYRPCFDFYGCEEVRAPEKWCQVPMFK